MKKVLCLTAFISVFFCCKKDSAVNNGPSSTPNAANFLATGKSANDFLSATTYSTLTIEIQYAPGMKPQDQSINNLVTFLNTHLNKPGGINVTLTPTASADSATITSQTAANLERQRRTQYNNGSFMTVYVYFADAGFTTNTNVIGVAYRNTSLVILQKTIQSKTNTATQRIQIESGVLEHEFGHLLGLVNTGTPMVANHEDAANKGHCNNSKCLMFYQVEANGLMNMSVIPALDVNCINDLKGNGGK